MKNERGTRERIIAEAWAIRRSITLCISPAAEESNHADAIRN